MKVFPACRIVPLVLAVLIPLPASITALTARAIADNLPVTGHAAPLVRARIQNSRLAFEPGAGPATAQVQFVAHTSGYTVFLQPRQVTIAFRGQQQQPREKQSPLTRRASSTAFISLRLLQSDPFSAPTAEEPLLAQANYFVGSEPQKWRTKVPMFGKVRYPSVYKNVDLLYYGNQEHLEYDFVVRPGGRPQSIRFSLEGKDRAELGQNGDLIVGAAASQFVVHRPIAYQIVNSQKLIVTACFLPFDRGEFGIQVGSYDPELPLIIDPVLTYSTYVGGSNDEGIFGIRFDRVGNIYVAGETSSLDFPTQQAAQSNVAGNYDAFVSKFDPTGTKLIYSTYLGGSQFDHAVGIQLDGSGNVYVAGITTSQDFPVRNAWQPLPGGGQEDGFVAKLGPSGSELVFSTYLGGAGRDEVNSLAVDHHRHIYVTGFTNSLDFPVTSNAFQQNCDGKGAFPGFCIGDAFVTKFDESGSGLAYSTYVGGRGSDIAEGLAVDGEGQAYLAGQTGSSDFPIQDPFQSSLSGPRNAFITKLNTAGSEVVFSTFLGGSRFDSASDLALDRRRNVYVTGMASSTDFPLVRPVQSKNQGGPSDGFVAKIDTQASKLVYSTYLGGTGRDFPFRIAVNTREEASVVGFTSSIDFPMHDALNSSYNGGSTDAFVVTFDRSGEKLLFATYLGGSGDEFGYSITIGCRNSLWVGGSTSSQNFPTIDAFQIGYAGGPFDAFLSKIGGREEPSEHEKQAGCHRIKDR